MTRSQEQLWSPVPESHHHWVKVCQWLQRRVEESRKGGFYAVAIYKQF